MTISMSRGNAMLNVKHSNSVPVIFRAMVHGPLQECHLIEEKALPYGPLGQARLAHVPARECLFLWEKFSFVRNNSREAIPPVKFTRSEF